MFLDDTYSYCATSVALVPNVSTNSCHEIGGIFVGRIANYYVNLPCYFVLNTVYFILWYSRNFLHCVETRKFITISISFHYWSISMSQINESDTHSTHLFIYLLCICNIRHLQMSIPWSLFPWSFLTKI
jgi:hypothetical protein